MSVNEVVIVSAARTPVGSFNGASAACPPTNWAPIAIKAPSSAPALQPADVDEVILGQVLQAAPARARPARPRSTPAFPSKPGLEPQPALRLGPARRGAGRPADRAGDSAIVVAGGQESMSQAPHAATCATARRWATSASSTP